MNDAAGLILDGARLAAVGMGTVFVFLTLLVVATAGMSRLVARFAPPAAAERDPADDARLVAVITAAIQAHRARRR